MMQLATRIAAVAALAALATGCATASTSTPAATGGASGTGAASASPPASASAGGTPVPTTTTGPPLVAGQPACVGWPANATHSKLPASFEPVAVIRCVTDYQMIPGKGQWLTATLERADQGLAPLLTALQRPNQTRPPGTFCSALVELPPQFVLVDKDGQAIRPALPVTGCGLVQGELLGALAALPWQKVSVRLVAKV